MSGRRFTGRTVAITGASQGLGRELAKAFAREGATVALVARSTEKLEAVAREISNHGGRSVAFPSDVADAGAVDALRVAVDERLGPVDVLINNAGIAGPTAVLWE